MILTLLAAGTLLSLMLLCRSHIIVDGSKTTRLIYYLTVVSCMMFLVCNTINGDPRLYAAVQMLEGYVSITVAFVLASIWCRIYERAYYVKRFVVPVFSTFVTAIFVVYVLGALGTFARTRSWPMDANKTETRSALVLDCQDDTWIIFSILESILVTFSLFASCGIAKKLQEMVLSEDYRRRKTKQVWLVAVIYSISVFTTLTFSLYSRERTGRHERCARWSTEVVESDTIGEALPQMLGSLFMYILDTLVPMWSVVILIRHLFYGGSSMSARRTSSWNGDEYIGRLSLLSEAEDNIDDGPTALGIDDILEPPPGAIASKLKSGGLN